MLSNLILGLQNLQKAGATSAYAVSEAIYVYGADVTAGVEDFEFYWDDHEEAWVFYT